MHTLYYIARMKTYVWNTEKNDLIVRQRDVSFEQVVLNIQLGNEVDIYDHPNVERYPNKKYRSL